MDPVSHERHVLVHGRGATANLDDAPYELAEEPAWSPDGKRIAFVAFGSRTRIEAVDVETRRVRRVARGLGDAASGYGLRWSPDGRRIAYVDRDHRAVGVAEADGGGARVVLRGGGGLPRLGIVRWDGSSTLVVRTPRGTFAVAADGARVRRVRAAAARHAHGPRVLVRARDRAGDDEIAVVGGGRRIGFVTADRARPGHVRVRSCCPRSSPDGRWVAFVRNGAAVVVGAGGRGERVVDEDARLAGWSPDGRYLLLARTVGGASSSLYAPRTRRHVVVSRSFGRGGYEYAPAGAAWQPAPAPRTVALSPPHEPRPPHFVATPFRETPLAQARTRIVDVVRIADGGAADLSLDGARLAVTHARGPHSAEVGVVDLRTGRERAVGVTAAPVPEPLRFDPRGRRVLFLRWTELWEAPAGGGRARRLARDAHPPYRWLRDGGIAYADGRGRVVVRRATTARYELPRGIDGLAISPSGTRVLYARNCDVWVRDLRSGRVRRFAHATYDVTALSWSPTGTAIALAASWWSNCENGFDWYHASTALFDARGRPLARVGGTVVAWSPDGRRVLTSGGVTGSNTGPLQPLELVDLHTRTSSLLLRARSTGFGALARDGTIAFGRFDNPRAFTRGGFARPRYYLGRLAPP